MGIENGELRINCQFSILNCQLLLGECCSVGVAAEVEGQLVGSFTGRGDVGGTAVGAEEFEIAAEVDNIP